MAFSITRGHKYHNYKWRLVRCQVQVQKNDGLMWSFQTCSYLVEQIGFSQTSMFLPKAQSFSWLLNRCYQRFNISTSLPYYYVNKRNYTDVLQNPSNVLFTNGCNDGQFVGNIIQNITNNSDIIVLNFPNGAHHSDLSRNGPNYDTDTDDIKDGYFTILSILKGWLSGIGRKSQAASFQNYLLAWQHCYAINSSKVLQYNILYQYNDPRLYACKDTK